MKSLFSRLLVVSVGLGIALPPTAAQVNLGQLGQIGRMPFTPTKTILQAQNQDIETLLKQALQYTQQGKPQQAIEIFQQVLKLAQQKRR